MTAFAMAATVLTIFIDLYPRVMVSSTDPSYSLTVTNASSSPYALKVMTVVAVIFLPVVMIYQAWSYHVFRKRIGTAQRRETRDAAALLRPCVRPLDPRLLARTRGARPTLLLDVAFGFVATLLILAQADAVRGHRGARVRRRALAPLGRWSLFAAVVLARGVVAGAFETTGRRAAASRHVRAPARAGVVGACAPRGSRPGARPGRWRPRPSRGSTVSRRTSRRYLPQVVLAALVPVIVLLWTAVIDLTSALIMLVTLPLIPVFMVLIGRYTEARTRARWRALARLSNHFLDVVRGLPTLRAFNRGAAQAERIEAVSEDVPGDDDGDAPRSFLPAPCSSWWQRSRRRSSR